MRINKYKIIWEHTKALFLPLNIPVSYSEITLENISGQRVHLCVYYNARISENYDFDKKYYFFVTEEDISLDIFLSLGNPSSIESKVLEQFSDLASLKKSEYYNYFSKMRRNILKEVIKEKLLKNKYNKKFIKNPRFLDCYLQKNQGIVFSGYCNNTKEFVRLIVNAEQNKYLLKTCKSYFGNIDYYILPDFDELDERLLHLQTIHKEIDVLNIDKDSPYYDFIEWAKHQMSWPSIKISNEINPSEIDNMEYIENTYFMRDEPPTCIRKVLFPKNGEITKSIDEESSVVKIVTESEMHDFFELISNFLTTCNLGFERFIDDSEGSLYIHYNDGHIEEYDRGLTKNGISLLSIIRHYTQDNDF